MVVKLKENLECGVRIEVDILLIVANVIDGLLI